MKTITDLLENYRIYNWRREIYPSMASDILNLFYK